MYIKLAIVAISVLLVVGCGSESSQNSDNQPVSITVAALPTTLEGELQIDVQSGEVDEAGYSEYNFGALIVGDQEILVEVSGEVLRAVGLPEGFGAVVATISSGPGEQGHYKITRVRRP